MAEAHTPFSLDYESRGMTRKVTSSVAWTSALHGVVLVVNLIFTAILARLLAPADFGVIAGAMILLGFAQMLLQNGVVPTLVQMRDLTVADLRGGLTLVLLLALIVFLLLEATAPIAADLLRLDEIEAVLKVLAFGILIEAIGIIPEALLIRRLEVRRVMIIEICGRIAGTGAIAISLAYYGWGYWALVAAKLAEAAFKAGALLILVESPKVPLLDRGIMGRLVPKGTGFTTRAVLNFIGENADNAIVGRYFDAASLGLYSRAYHLMSLPADLYGKVARRVVFPAMARVRDEPIRLKGAYLHGLALTAVFGLPACAVFVVLAPDLVRVLLGDRWLGVVPILMVLVASMYLRLGANVSGSLLNACGSAATLVVIKAIYAGMVIVGCLLSYPHGLLVLAAAVVLANLIQFCAISIAGCRIAGAGTKAFFGAHVHGLCLAILSGLIAWAAAAPWWARGFEGLLPILSAGAALSLFGLVVVVLRPGILLGKSGKEFVLEMQSLFATRLPFLLRRVE